MLFSFVSVPTGSYRKSGVLRCAGKGAAGPLLNIQTPRFATQRAADPARGGARAVCVLLPLCFLSVTFPSLRVPAFLHRDSVQQAIKAVLALGAMGYLVYIVEPAKIAAAVAGARYDLLAAAVLLLPLNVLLEGATWRRILAVVVPGARGRRMYGALLCGYALGLVTPARAGGLAGRALYFERGDRWAIAATVFVQRLLDMLTAVACGTAALGWALAAGVLAGLLWKGFLAAGVGITLALLLLLVWPRRAAAFVHRTIPSETAREHLAFLKRLRPRRMAGAALPALARFGVYATQFVLLARAFAPGASFALLYGGTGLVFFAKHLIPSLTMMDVGIREGAAVFFLHARLGVPEAAAFNAAFVLFLTNLVLPAAAGAPLLLRLRFEKDDASPDGANVLDETPANSETPANGATPADKPREATAPPPER